MGEQNNHQQNLDPSTNQSKQQNTLVIVFLVILVLIVSGVAGYTFHQNNQLKKQINELKNTPKHSSTDTTATLSTTPSLNSPEISRLEKITFVKNGDIFTINPDGSEEKRLTTYGANWAPVFSPEGQWIAYASLPKELKGQGVAPTPANIWVIKPDGSGARKISKESRVMGNILWSPDSKKIAFSTDSSIVIIDIQTNEETVFIDDAGPAGITPANPVWLNPETLIYFKKLPESPQEAGIAIANLNKKTTEWITKEPYFSNIIYSPKKNKIYAQYKNEKTLWQIDPVTKKTERINKLNWNISEDVWLRGDIKLTPTQDRLIVPIGFNKNNPSSVESEIVFLTIDVDTGNTETINTGLKFCSELNWIADKNWLVLNGILIGQEASAEGEATKCGLWGVNLGNQTKQKLTDNVRNFDGFWIIEK